MLSNFIHELHTCAVSGFALCQRNLRIHELLEVPTISGALSASPGKHLRLFHISQAA
jgi:hypothetical protein